MFEDEIGVVRIIIESHSGWGSNEDMEMSSAPSFGAPVKGLKKHKFTAKLVILQRNFGSCIILF